MNRSIIDKITKYLDTAFPLFFFLLAVSFYLRTYDSAMVKITEVQMFGTILVALWLCKIFESGHWPFSKSQTLIVLPFIAIFASGVLSFIRSPLHWGSFDFFVRRVIYIGIAMIAITEMTSLPDFRRMTRWLVIGVSVVTIYGLIQFIDTRYFPPGPPTLGIDKFVWRGAFAQRVFSTFGNPNFYSNFLVVMIPVMAALYLKSRSFYLLPLILLTLANIYWTNSKGPAMGLIAGTVVFSTLLLLFFVKSRKIKIAVISSASLIILILGGYIYLRVFVQGGITSFTFRMYTWLSTWEMINEKPILGNGIGTFWVLYPAYRRPAIFHIEGKHNTETDHSENEHLEVWMDEGIVGMGCWLWMILTMSVGVYKTLSSLTSQSARASPLNKKENDYPEEVYYILGFFSGFLGMLMHNMTDVSMRFVSSGAPFWLLAGMNASLIIYSPLFESSKSAAINAVLTEPQLQGLKKWFLKILRGLVMVAVFLTAVRILRIFDWCQGRDGFKNPNEVWHFVITWGVFLMCWSSASWWFIQMSLRCMRFTSFLTISASLFLLAYFWGFFIGDVNHNRAIFFSKQGIWNHSPEYDNKVMGFPPEYRMIYSGGSGGVLEKNTTVGKIVNFIFPDVFWRKNGIGGAIEHYDEVNRLKPDFIMAHYFRGNVYNDWGAQYSQKTQEAFQRGDVAQGEIYRKKADELWEKAMSAYVDTKKLGPNYVQMHHQVGSVHHKWGEFLYILAPMAERYGRPELANEYRKKAKEHWNEAIQSFKLYYKIDPVYDQNYYRQAQIYVQSGEPEKAEQVYLDFLEAKECKKPYHQIFGGFYVKERGTPNSRYDLASPEHTHDITIEAKPEVWIHLGNFYSFVRPSPKKAEQAYKRAVEIRPEDIGFVKQLASFYGRNGRVQEAIQFWQRAFQLNPNDPDVQNVIKANRKS